MEVKEMINEKTRRKLRELNMGEFVKDLELQQSEPATIALSFDERMQRLTDYVDQEKYNSKIQRLIAGAKLRIPQADIHSLYYEGRGLNRKLLMEYGDAVVMTGQQKKLLAKYSHIPLLIIDEWLMADISESELYFLFELIGWIPNANQWFAEKNQWSGTKFRSGSLSVK